MNLRDALLTILFTSLSSFESIIPEASITPIKYINFNKEE